MTTPFSKVMAKAEGGRGRRRLDVPTDWLQGRTAFGGLQVALALSAMRDLVDAPLRSIQAIFVAPVPGGPVEARAAVLRTGKSATQVEARIGDPDLATIVVAVFGTPRRSAVAVTPVQPAVESSEPRVLPFDPALVPAFVQHFDARWLVGSPPFTGDRSTHHVIELSLRDDGPCSEAHVLAFADFIPPVALSHLIAPAPGSSVNWMLELLAGDVDALPLSGWRVDAELMFARDGYTSQSLVLWGPGGEPIALGRQSMTVFD